MNGNAGRPSADDYGVPSPSGIDPSGRVVVESYGRDIVNGFEKDPPLHNAANVERTQSSAHVDLKDPIQIHLLTETALSDSKEYEILSQEEIDGLKKQTQMLTQRIESTRSNLLIQAKYRDAAVSMAKLYSPNRADAPGPEELASLREAETEREACERRCEELAAELFHLEKRIMEPKRRLLEHTAGVLQLTHKGSRGRAAGPNGLSLNGVPGSPESLYTYNQSRTSLEGADDYYTDDTSFYGFDQLDSRGPRKNNPLEIPLKSPGREMDRLKEENRLLMESVADMEHKLEGLNGSLRETIVRFNPDGNSEFEGPPSAAAAQGEALKPGQMLRSQVEYLESGLVAVQAEQESYMGEGPRGTSGDVERTLVELWDMVQSGYNGIKQQKDERRRARAERGLEDDESDDEGIDLTEEYTIHNFTSRVRWLYRQATTLKDQRSVLRRQIKQQRELNNKSDAEKDAELAQKQEELEQNRLIVDRAEKDAMDAQKMLSQTLEDLEEARAAASSAESNNAQVRELQTQLADKEKEYDTLNMTCAELKTEVTIARAELDSAYGTRAERAADVAAAKSSDEVDRLRDELAETAKELESITKETIASEREKLDLENKLDEALAARSELQAELQAARDRLDEEIQRSRDKIARLQDDLDGERLRAGRGSGETSRPGAGATMLSEQFRATMREERKKFQEDIREERSRNRKLEEELSRLKRAQGPGKSPLSPR